MRNRYDQIAKQLGVLALAPAGKKDHTTPQFAVNGETMFADLRHDPDPAPECAAIREELGLLGRLAEHDCLIELHSQAPGLDEFRACLTKHLVYWQSRLREARASDAAQVDAPYLWIISAGVPRRLLADLSFTSVAGWPPGIYALGREALRVGLVLASELPVDSSTLLVRLMAGGPLLARAVPEVAALDKADRKRLVAEPVLLDFAHVLETRPSHELDEHEQELIMVMHKTWEDARMEGREEGRQEGREEGRQQELVTVLRTLLIQRFGAITPELDERLATASRADLERALERILTAPSAAAVFE